MRDTRLLQTIFQILQGFLTPRESVTRRYSDDILRNADGEGLDGSVIFPGLPGSEPPILLDDWLEEEYF